MKLQELPIGNTPIVEITYIYKNKLKKFPKFCYILSNPSFYIVEALSMNDISV